MARIEYQDGSGLLKSVEVPRVEQGCLIGRSPQCHVVLSSHSVSRTHGRILADNDRFVFQDLGGVNGSFVNDRKVIGTVGLSDGDVIRLGDIRVTFRADAAEAPVSVEPAVVPEPSPEPEEPVVAPAPDPVVPPPATPQAVPAQPSVPAVDSRRDDEVRHLRGLLEDARRRVQDAENRAAVSASALDGIHGKYAALREEARHLQERLDAVRAEADESVREASELRGQVRDLGERLEAIQSRKDGAADEIAGLKVRLTERDREIDRLRRDLDAQAFDLKTLREENARLEDYCRTDTGRQQGLERKVRNLEGVIEENRNLIEELRRTIEEREVRLRQLRSGAATGDAEDDRRRLLDDFHRKSRELEEALRQVATLRARQDAPVQSAELPPGAEVSAALADAVDALEGDLAVLRADARTFQALLTALADSELPPKAAGALAGATPGEVAAGLTDLLRILADDLAALRLAVGLPSNPEALEGGTTVPSN